MSFGDDLAEPHDVDEHARASIGDAVPLELTGDDAALLRALSSKLGLSSASSVIRLALVALARPRHEDSTSKGRSW